MSRCAPSASGDPACRSCAFFVVEGPFRICQKERGSTRERKRSQAIIANKIHDDHSPFRSLTLCSLLPVSWLLSPPRRSVPIAVLPLGLVQAAASHAATHEQVNHASRGHKPRAIRGVTQRTKTDQEPGEVGAVGEACSAHRRPVCVIRAYQRAERIFAEVGHEADRFSALCQLERSPQRGIVAGIFL